MAKKNCIKCKNCILRPAAYHDGMVNTCKFDDKIHELSQEELMKRIATNECDLFEKGEPDKSNEFCYDD